MNYQKSEPKTIQTLFGSIASHYDKTNTLMSLGMHKYWNRSLVKALTPSSTGTLLDLCAGTGEIAFSYLKGNPSASAILLDFCPEMLAIAEQKGAPFNGRFSMIEGDAQAIPLPYSSVEAISMAYGIRNILSPDQCFKEVHRVLKPGGLFGILELTRPSNSLVRFGHRVYLKTLLPLVGKWAAKDHHAYAYLSKSIESFSSPLEIQNRLYKSGFATVEIRPLLYGIATLILARKS